MGTEGLLIEGGPKAVFIVTVAGLCVCMLLGVFFALIEWLYTLWKDKRQCDGEIKNHSGGPTD